MRTFSATVLSLFLANIATLAATVAQTDIPTSLLTAYRTAVVQLEVQGKVNNVAAAEDGTGFLISTSQGPRIITAGHVVGPDDRWDSIEDRLIYYRIAQFGSSLTLDPVTDAKEDLPQIDMAEVYLDPFQASTFQVVSQVPTQGEALTVINWRGWGRPTARATAQAAQVVRVDNDRLVLSGSYIRSDSGSPVLNSDGRLVAMLVEAASLPNSTTQGLAIPISKMMPFLSEATASPITKTPVPILANIPIYHHHYWSRRPTNSETAILPTREGCVFLGKRSARLGSSLSDMPFGLTLIATLRNSETRRRLVGQSLQASANVNLRSKCPTVKDGIAYYGAVTAHLSPRDTVVPSEVQALDYLDDVFYWAEGRAIATSRRAPVRQ
jgi:hypothetical protein